MSADALSNKQFNTERSMLEQGNMDELATRVRGIQSMTSNVFRPAFSSDYSTVHSMPSPASARATGQGVEEDIDQEE
jgi:hypothetical protein